MDTTSLSADSVGGDTVPVSVVAEYEPGGTNLTCNDDGNGHPESKEIGEGEDEIVVSKGSGTRYSRVKYEANANAKGTYYLRESRKKYPEVEVQTANRAVTVTLNAEDCTWPAGKHPMIYVHVKDAPTKWTRLTDSVPNGTLPTGVSPNKTFSVKYKGFPSTAPLAAPDTSALIDTSRFALGTD